MILDDRLPFIQWHDVLLMLDGQLFRFPARKSQNAKEIVFKIDTPVCIIAKTAITLAQKFTRLRVVPHFSSEIVERAKRERA